ncbi:uncharacterized protein LOC135108429 [Scylla paramamosain]|uniref:uncharacterized protein LOC135108429 n=1 Tax=Scylla paramamosain TaxID=85552 RepID=UPI003083A9EE
MDEGNISNSGIPSPPAVSPSPMPPQSHTISHSDMGKPRPPHSASHKQTVFDGEGVFTITRSPSVVTQQPSLTVLPHQPHDEDHDDLHNNNIINTNNKEVSEKYQLGLDPLKDGSNKKDTTAPVTNTVHAAGVAAAFGGGAVVASTAAAAASAADDPCSAYMRRVCCEALCDPLCLMCCLACNADCCSGCANLDLCCLLCHICTRL